MELIIADGVLALLGCFFLYKIFFSQERSYPLPPGPRGWPIIGNALDMPRTHAWRTFAEWGASWGPLMSIKVLGTPFVIVNDPEIADELLSKTGSLYADRPTIQMAELTGWDRALSGARYNARFREYRKLIGKVIGTKGNMNPDDPAAATRKTAAAMVLHLTYGYKIAEDRPDPLVTKVDFAMAQFADIHRTGAYLVEIFPMLKYLPAWFPYAYSKRKAAESIGPCNEMADVPFAYVKEQLAKGEENNSFAADLIKMNISEEKLTDLKWSAASFYAAGSDTTVSVVYSYLMAAVLYPEIQRKAQAEVDAIVGKDRLPSFGDRESLPYVEAVVKELYRWLPIVPLAVPHRAMEDNIFRGYLIPKDSLVFVNVWHYLHDPAVYKDPNTFNPERYLGPNAEPDPVGRGLFGYGRRICPGLHLADVSVWINIVKAVAAVQVEPALDANGVPKLPVPETTDGIIVRPIPFDCVVKPRSEQVLHVLEEALNNGKNVN
ncbi:hypothetical protein D9757_013390 [Collybiopsis confluens]|uniref:Cytochrome P450 n=1 Tax=Collybiopsis confluens TaxID=2823264 RepID=A0A8H5CP34_9AGAR|nr:hypothetical protein D9757_013390 [Collybiopsis confluens]